MVKNKFHRGTSKDGEIDIAKNKYESKYSNNDYDKRKFGYPVVLVTEDYHFTTKGKNEYDGLQSNPNRKISHQMETLNKKHVNMRKQKIGIDKKESKKRMA